LLLPSLLWFLLWLFFPLAFYCLVLGTINRRVRPLPVSGGWDFVGLLCALSGLLLIDGPLLIRLYHDRAEKTIYQRDIENAAKGAPQMGPDEDDQKKDSVDEQVSTALALWRIVWVLYFLVVLGGAALLVWARRNVLVIYNIEGPAFQDALTRTLERLGMLWHLEGRHLLLRRGIAVAGPGDGGAAPAPPWAECDVASFPVMCHVTMHWRRDPQRLRPQVEGELARQLKEVRTYDNPAAGWFLSVASCLFGLVLMGVVIVLLGVFWPRWR